VIKISWWSILNMDPKELGKSMKKFMEEENETKTN